MSSGYLPLWPTPDFRKTYKLTTSIIAEANEINCHKPKFWHLFSYRLHGATEYFKFSVAFSFPTKGKKLCHEWAKKCKEEFAFFLDGRNHMTFNTVCKHSFRTCILECPYDRSKRSVTDLPHGSDVGSVTFTEKGEEIIYFTKDTVLPPFLPLSQFIIQSKYTVNAKLLYGLLLNRTLSKQFNPLSVRPWRKRSG